MVKIVVMIVTLTLFFTAAFAEIGGGYLVWLWLRKNRVLLFGLVGGMVLFVYGIIQTLQPATLEEYMLHMVAYSFFYLLYREH
jgi:drug/metabolite transporter superfamily protein YnfA